MADEPDCCKVGRVAAEYDLGDQVDELADEWQADSGVRPLAERFNRTVIEATLDRANTGRAEWSRAPVYEALATDEMSESAVIEIRRELERGGIDVDELSSSLISHQTLYRHFRNCLDVSKDTTKSPAERRESARDTVYSLQERAQQVTASTIDHLRTAGVAAVGDVDVVVDVRVVCRDCGRSMDFETAITGGCDCGTS